MGDRHLLGLLEVCVCCWEKGRWFGGGVVGGGGVHVHLGLSCRPELISVEEGGVGGVSRGREGAS